MPEISNVYKAGDLVYGGESYVDTSRTIDYENRFKMSNIGVVTTDSVGFDVNVWFPYRTLPERQTIVGLRQFQSLGARRQKFARRRNINPSKLTRYSLDKIPFYPLRQDIKDFVTAVMNGRVAKMVDRRISRMVNQYDDQIETLKRKVFVPAPALLNSNVPFVAVKKGVTVKLASGSQVVRGIVQGRNKWVFPKVKFFPNFPIYGYWSMAGDWIGFATTSQHGFHHYGDIGYRDTTPMMHKLCMGDFQPCVTRENDIKVLHKYAHEAKTVLEWINMDSLGSSYCPQTEEWAAFKQAMRVTGGLDSRTVSLMVDEGIIIQTVKGGKLCLNKQQTNSTLDSRPSTLESLTLQP